MSFLFNFFCFFTLFTVTYSLPTNDIFCSLCVDLFESALNADPDDIGKFLEERSIELCKVFPLPIDVTQECYDYLNPFFSKGVQLLNIGESPNVACYQIGICEK